MAFRIGIPAETESDEQRVALTPDVAARLLDSLPDVTLIIESGAGEGAHHSDAEYESAGVQVADREAAFGADLVAKVQPPSSEEIALLSSGQSVIGFLSPLDRPEVAQQLAQQGVTALSMELVPRISRAQKMDALSAMSSIGGYRAVLIAAHALPKFFPLLTTAAGTIKPANVLVIGAGVAGLQAIATAKRLGARVAGYDIRPAVKEEVQSLGAGFLELQLDTDDAQTEGGYAKELQQEIQERQPELLQPHIANADVVISTALIPGRPAPLLINEGAVEDMASGSVIIDLAAPNGGNCALTEKGATVTRHGVTIHGPLNLPAEMPVHASQLYARTIAAMIEEFATEDGFTPNFDDEIFAESCVAHDGQIVNDRVKELV
jgi:NAD(P) transhydrogenase subunit alpha